jgi:hypothetical protein
MDCITSKTVKTRKPHRCWWCGEAIEVGSSVGLETGIDDGQWFRSYWHPECSAAFQRDKECNGPDGVGFGEHVRGVACMDPRDLPPIVWPHDPNFPF